MNNYRVNVDRPTHVKLHTVNDNYHCQPREKKPKDGHWAEFQTRSEALNCMLEHISGNAGKLRFCKICDPMG